MQGVNLRAVVDGADADSGVPSGAELVAFVEAAVAGDGDLTEARSRLEDALGGEAVVDAAAVIGNFQRMTRIADSTGIPVDERTAAFTEDLRDALGLNEFVSARLSE